MPLHRRVWQPGSTRFEDEATAGEATAGGQEQAPAATWEELEADLDSFLRDEEALAGEFLGARTSGRGQDITKISMEDLTKKLEAAKNFRDMKQKQVGTAKGKVAKQGLELELAIFQKEFDELTAEMSRRTRAGARAPPPPAPAAAKRSLEAIRRDIADERATLLAMLDQLTNHPPATRGEREGIRDGYDVAYGALHELCNELVETLGGSVSDTIKQGEVTAAKLGLPPLPPPSPLPAAAGGDQDQPLCPYRRRQRGAQRHPPRPYRRRQRGAQDQPPRHRQRRLCAKRKPTGKNTRETQGETWKQRSWTSAGWMGNWHYSNVEPLSTMQKRAK